MGKRFGYFIFGGLLIGVLLGSLWATGGDAVLGIAIGAFVGAAIGWFGAAAATEKEKEKEDGK